MVNRKYKEAKLLVDSKENVIGRELFGENTVIRFIDFVQKVASTEYEQLIFTVIFADIKVKITSRFKTNTLERLYVTHAIKSLQKGEYEKLYNLCLFLLQKRMASKLVEYAEAKIDYNPTTDLWPYNMIGRINQFKSWDKLEKQIIESINITTQDLNTTNDYQKHFRRNLN